MPWKIKCVWIAYFVVFASAITHNTLLFLNPETKVFQYFFFLRQFDQFFLFDYLLTTAQIVLNIIFLLPIIFYIFQIKTFSKTLWQYGLILRLIFDICGHSYELHNLTALYHSNSKIAIIVYIQVFFFHVPSYAACYLYAFQKNQIFAKPSSLSENKST